jgi:CheY-like chemotaxis protein
LENFSFWAGHSGSEGSGMDKHSNVKVPMKTRKCILIVDDDSDVLLFLEDRLNALGYDVLAAANGQKGLEVIRGHSVDGVLLDLDMPVMGGIPMLEKLGMSSANPPVIVMSANDHRPELQQAIIKGAMDFLIKPIVHDELANKCLRIFQ